MPRMRRAELAASSWEPVTAFLRQSMLQERVGAVRYVQDEPDYLQIIVD